VSEPRLLPCPFCGSTLVQLSGAGPGHTGDMDAFVECLACETEGPLFNGPEQRIDEAADAWNSALRPPPTDPEETPGTERKTQ